jgi:hypothetical protein
MRADSDVRIGISWLVVGIGLLRMSLCVAAMRLKVHRGPWPTLAIFGPLFPGIIGP